MADIQIQKGKRLVNAEILGKVAQGLKNYADDQAAAAESTASSALGTAKTELEGKISTAESAAKTYADNKDTALKSEIQSKINTINSNIEDIQETLGGTGGTSIKDQIAAIQQKDQEQDGKLTVLQGEGDGSVKKALADAKKYADDQDAVLKAQLQQEIDDDVKVEADRATAVEAKLDTAIKKEATDRANDVAVLWEGVEGVAENIAKIMGDEETGALGLLGEINKTIANEIQDRTNGDTALQTQIDAMKNEDTGILKQAKDYTDTREAAERSRAQAAEAQALSDAKDYADEKISALVNSAPEDLNTLKELADAIATHGTVVDGYVSTINGKIADAEKAAKDYADAQDTKLHTTISAKIDTDVKAEADRAKGEEAKLDTAIKAEASRADTAEKALDTAIKKEVTDRQTAVSGLRTDLEAEINRLDQAIGENGSVAEQIEAAVSAEAALREAGDQANAQAAQTAQQAANKAQGEVDTLEGVVTNLGTELRDADNALQGQINEVLGMVEDIGNMTDGMIGSIVTDIAEETAARTQADTTLQNAINKEVTDRQTAVSGEATARENADTALQKAINDEVTRAKAAEKVNTDAIAALKGAGEGSIQAAVKAEETRALAAESNLQKAINQEVTDRQTAVSGEATARANAISDLQSKVVATFNNLNLQIDGGTNGKPVIRITLDGADNLGKSPLSDDIELPVMTDGEVNDMLSSLGLTIN